MNLTRYIRQAGLGGIVLVLLGLLLLVRPPVNTLAEPLRQEGTAVDPCAPPTVTPTSLNINVRAGPGTDYAVIATLPRGQERPVIGRARYSQFWQIALNEEEIGWVADSVVVIRGDFSRAPLIDAPLIGGLVPTPGQPWNPLPAVTCDATPTPVAVAAVASTRASERTRTAPDQGQITVSDDGWQLPVNLSESGSASAPQMLRDASGTIHVLWQDSILGFHYVAGRPGAAGGFEWDLPRLIADNLPFGQARPVWTNDGRGVIYAFWLGPQGSLLAARVGSGSFADPAAWLPVQTLSGQAVAVKAAADDQGQIHLAYVGHANGPTSPAGIYYRRSTDGGASWSPAIAIYQSEYLRSANPANANIDLAASSGSGGTRVLVAWDDPLLARVFVAQSGDGGQNWAAPIEIDSRQPTDSEAATIPSRIQVRAAGEQALLIWQAGHEGTPCRQYFRASSDGGLSWSTADEMLISLPLCPDTNQFAGETADGRMVLLTTLQTQTFILAWDGGEWSLPQLQDTLTTFVNPATFRVVDFRCHQPALIEGVQLLLVGCGLGAVNDIWFTSRTLDDVDDWFLPPSPWLPPAMVVTTTQTIHAPSLIADQDGRIHAIWEQPSASDSRLRLIFYSRRQDGSWNRPLAVLASPSGSARFPSAALAPDGRLSVAWQADDGRLYFAQVAVERATIQAEWSTPALLPGPFGSVEPDLFIDSTGVIYVAYATPLNEQRGIYLVRSEDNGRSWSEPALVFDAAAAGWEMAGPPQLAGTDSGQLHLVWSRLTLPLAGRANQTKDLYYARSVDGGLTFGPAELIVDSAIDWSDVAVDSRGMVHRFWQENTGTALSLWHQTSIDHGASWNQADPVASGLGEPLIVTGKNGLLAWLQLTPSGLRKWLWQDGIWTAAEDLALAPAGANRALTATFVDQGFLAAAFVTQLAGRTSAPPITGLAFTERPIDIPAAAPPLPTPTAASAAAAPATPTAEPTEAPLIDVTIVPEEPAGQSGFLASLPGGTSSTGRLIFSLAPAVLLVLLVFAVGLRRVRSRG